MARPAPLSWKPEPVCYDDERLEAGYADITGFATTLYAGKRPTRYDVAQIEGADGQGHLRVGGDKRLFWVPRHQGRAIPDPDQRTPLMYEGERGLARAREICEQAYRPSMTARDDTATADPPEPHHPTKAVRTHRI